MRRRFGYRATFAVEVGEVTPPDLRTVDLWAAGKELTTDDDVVLVPAFVRFLRSTAAQVRRRAVEPCPFPGRSPEEILGLLRADDETDLPERFWFMHRGETVDNVTSYAYLDDDLVIVFGYSRATHPTPDELGRVLVVRIPPDDFARTLEEAADLLTATR